MSFIDIVLGAVLIWGTIQGVRQGFFAALTSFIAYILGIYLAIKFSSVVASYIEPKVEWNPKTIEIAAFGITFVGVVILLFFIAKIFTKLADWAYLGWVNRLLGGLFGLLKYTLLLSVCLNLFEKINFNNFFMSEETKTNSIFYDKVQYTAQLVYPSLEEWYNDLKNLDKRNTEELKTENNL
nr:CvpA family protein [uncultured Flavobacterium sp.]